MCPWVGPHASSFGRQHWGLPSRVGYLSPQGVLLPLVYGTTASHLWLELRGRSAGHVTPSWTVHRLACQRLLPWLRVTFAMVADAAWPGSDQWPWSTAPATSPVGWLVRPSVSDPRGVGSLLSLGRPTCVRCPGPLGSCSPVCSRGLSCCLCGVLGHFAPVHLAPARCVVLCVGCPGSLGSCSPVCLAVVSHPFIVLGVCACAVSWSGGPCSLWCALCAVCVCRWWVCLSSSPPKFIFLFSCLLVSFFFPEKIDKTIFLFDFLQRRGRAYTAGTSMGNRCSGAIVSSSMLWRPRPRGAARAS